MAYTAADASERVVLIPFADVDGNLEDITATEWNAGIAIHDDILKTDFAAGATDSTVHNDTPLGSKGQWENVSGRNATATITVLRDLDENGRPDPEASAEVTFAAVKEPGSEFVIGVRQGPDPDEEIQADDEMRFVGIVSTDVPRPPSDPTAGFIKVVVPLRVRDFETYVNVPAAG